MMINGGGVETLFEESLLGSCWSLSASLPVSCWSLAEFLTECLLKIKIVPLYYRVCTTAQSRRWKREGELHAVNNYPNFAPEQLRITLAGSLQFEMKNDEYF